MTRVLSKEEVKSFKLVLRKISESLHAEEDLKEVRVVAKLLTEITPEDNEIWYFLGVLNIALGAFDEAQDNLMRSLELGGDQFSIYTRLVHIYMNQGNFKEAIQWGYRALKCNLEDSRIYHKIADLHVIEGDTRKAVKLLESLLKITTINTKDRYTTLVRLGHLCILMNRIKKALDYFKTAQTLNPSDESLWADIGHCLSRVGEIEGALTAFRKAAHSNPTSYNLYNLGDAYLALNNPEMSIAPLVEATRKDPGYSLAHYDLSLALIKMKKYAEALVPAIAALRSDPEMKLQQTNLGLGAMNNLGLCLMNLGRYEEALNCFRRNIKLLGPTFFNMGLTLFKMKHYKDALGYLKKVLDITPEDPEYLDLVGQTYTELGKYKVAEKFLRKSVEKDPKYALAHYDLGLLLARFKTKRKEAMHCFMTTIKLDPSLVWAYYSVACLYALSGDKEKALDYLRQSLEKGLSNKKHIDSDPDMDTLREEKEFKDLMTKYFPVKESSQ